MTFLNFFFCSFLDSQGNILQVKELKPSMPKSNTVSNIKPSIPITNSTEDTLAPKKQSRLKHFFSPIRKKAPPAINNAQPDVFVNNVVPSNMPILPIETIPNRMNFVPSSEIPISPITTVPSPPSFQVTSYHLQLKFEFYTTKIQIVNCHLTLLVLDKLWLKI